MTTHDDGMAVLAAKWAEQDARGEHRDIRETENTRQLIHHIGASRREQLASLKSQLFQVLANLAWPTVRYHRGDLFHDANWVSKQVDANLADSNIFAFSYGTREMGTDIGTDHELVSRFNDNAYQLIVFTHGKGDWQVTVETTKGRHVHPYGPEVQCCAPDMCPRCSGLDEPHTAV